MLRDVLADVLTAFTICVSVVAVPLGVGLILNHFGYYIVAAVVIAVMPLFLIWCFNRYKFFYKLADWFDIKLKK